MYYYKVVDENGNAYGVVAGNTPMESDRYIEITYEEYIELCEQLGIDPR